MKLMHAGHREYLIDAAVGVNENYRVDDRDRDLEVGFLYGTAEMIVALTLEDGESYHDVREEVAQQIDAKAAQTTYPVLQAKVGHES